MDVYTVGSVAVGQLHGYLIRGRNGQRSRTGLQLHPGTTSPPSPARLKPSIRRGSGQLLWYRIRGRHVQSSRPSLQLHPRPYRYPSRSFNRPSGVAVDSSSGNTVYVTEAGNNRVLVFNSTGTTSTPSQLVYPSIRRGSGQLLWYRIRDIYKRCPDSSIPPCTTSPTSPARLTIYLGVAVDSSSGTVYVTDYRNSRVLVFNSTRDHVATHHRLV